MEHPSTARPDSSHGGSIPSDLAWAAWKDAFYNLLIARATERDAATLGDDLDRAFVTRLGALGPSHGSDWHEGALRDLGHDLGRLIYGRHIRHDELSVALDHLGDVLGQSGFAEVRIAEVFHRHATLQVASPVDLEAASAAAWSRATPWVAFLAGLVQGALEAAFNCRATVVVEASSRFDVTLGDSMPDPVPTPSSRTPTEGAGAP